jgi:hypothetical protein
MHRRFRGRAHFRLSEKSHDHPEQKVGHRDQLAKCSPEEGGSAGTDEGSDSGSGGCPAWGASDLCWGANRDNRGTMPAARQLALRDSPTD